MDVQVGDNADRLSVSKIVMESKGEAKSWGDLIRREERRRKEVPWNGEDVEPRRFVTRYEVSRKEVEFNPILQRYANGEQEQTLQRRESDGRVQQLNQAKVKQLRNESIQDAITHTSKIPGSESHSSFFRESYVPPKSGYNIISNIDLSQHHYAHPENRPPPLKESKRRFKVLIKPREFNIITNRYEQEHDQKTEIDQDRNRKLATLRYWKTHDFNPITCSFYRKKKEEHFQEELAKREAAHGVDHLSRLPASLRVSEGNFCNIVTKEVKDPEMLRRWEKKHTTKKAGKAVASVSIVRSQDSPLIPNFRSNGHNGNVQRSCNNFRQ